MTALIIILSILAFILLLLLLPITIKASYTDELTLKVYYLFLRFTIVPQKEKKQKTKVNKKSKEPSNKKEKKQEQKKENSTIKDILKEKGIGGLIDIIKSIANIATTAIKGILNHLIVAKLIVNISVGAHDAAETAINYGYVCAGVYPSLGIILAQLKKCKTQEINIYPNFDSKKIDINCQLLARIKPMFIIGPAIKALFRAVKLLVKIKQET